MFLNIKLKIKNYALESKHLNAKQLITLNLKINHKFSFMCKQSNKSITTIIVIQVEF